MIKDRDYSLIAKRFGYALAFDRPLIEAVATDIDSCLVGEGRSAVIGLVNEAQILVGYYKQPNSSNLFGLVECFLPLDQDAGKLLATLIVTTAGQEFYVGLEDVSYVA
jgi:hypothetical protein